jgi:hypothetical protein
MVATVTQSPEADLDREIETLVGNIVRGTVSEGDRVRLSELQAQRFRLMRPGSSLRRSVGFYSRRLPV